MEKLINCRKDFAVMGDALNPERVLPGGEKGVSIGAAGGGMLGVPGRAHPSIPQCGV